jgi:hypothetical protein
MTKKLKCVWNMGDECSDDVEERTFFNSSIKVPVCSNHIEQHEYIMILHRNGYDPERILQETPEYRKQEVLVLQLSGLDDGKVDG